jgi:hypothetical protein
MTKHYSLRLQQRKETIEKQIKQLSEGVAKGQLRLEKKYKDLDRVREDMQKLKNEPPGITEHALLRYLERVIGIDMRTVKSEILPQKWLATISRGGDGKYRIGTHQVTVINNTIVTVTHNSC